MLPNTCPCDGPPAARAGPTSISWNVRNTHPATSTPPSILTWAQFLALYLGAVNTGDSVELKLWYREGKEFFTFSRSLSNRRRKKRKRTRRQFKPFSQSISGPLETQQSKVRSQESPWTVVNYQNNPQSQDRFQESTKFLPSSEGRSQRNHTSFWIHFQNCSFKVSWFFLFCSM